MAPPYQPTSLQDLPDELVLHVASYLHTIPSCETQSQAFKDKEKEKARQCENHARQKALHTLSLTSHRLNRISTPLLYSSFLSSSTWYGFRPIQLFHQTISAHPNLGQHIKYIENRLSDYLGNGLYDDMEFYGAVDMLAEYFFTLSLIISFAPNLQHLSVVSLETDTVSLWNFLVPAHLTFSTPHPHITTKSNQTSEPASESELARHGFPKLQTLALQIHTEDYGLGPESAWFRKICSSLTNIPSLTSLRASGVISLPPVAPWSGTYTRLQRLEITECILDFEEVVQLLLACIQLKHFACQWAFLNCGAETPEDLYQGILKHRDSLETLLLDVREVRFNHSPVSPSTAVGSLRDFTSLTCVEMCETSLLANSLSLLDFPDQRLPMRMADLLPPSLESFTLLVESDHGYDYDCRLDEAFTLWDLTQDCERLLPKLRSIVVKSRHDLSAPNLVAEFCDVGVVLRLAREARRQWED